MLSGPHHKTGYQAIKTMSPRNLNELLQAEIKDSGAMPLGRFMSLALCHPEFGYYTTRDPFGKDGDFTTAPEISQVFGEMIGAWVADIWFQMGCPKTLNLIECGAGRGSLMADIMRATKTISGFHDAVKIRIIETSPILQGIQKSKLHQYDALWHDSLDIGSVDDPCIILGNEFLDALPLEQIRVTNNAWQQRHVTVDKNSSDFGFLWRPIQNALNPLTPEVKTHNAIYEVAPERLRFIDDCAKIIKKCGGALLFIDYGHGKSASGDTLQAVKNHKFTPVLEDVGNCDITAHVDFEPLIRAATEQGVSALPLTTQRDFLLRLGISHRSKILQASAVKSQGAIRGQQTAQAYENDVDRLVNPDKMGTLFKVMCAYHGHKLKPEGFKE